MSVRVDELIDKFGFEVIVYGNSAIEISSTELNRPGLQFAGYYSHFSNERIQLIGMTEWSYMKSLPKDICDKRFKEYLKKFTPCIIVTRGLEIPEALVKYAKVYNRTILRTEQETTRVISRLKRYLDTRLAPETRVHGVLVDIYGIGVLIKGESSIGKSETALELIQRGHRLVADDAVEIRKLDDSVLTGQAPEVLRHFMEIRGLGIIDVKSLYGVGATKTTKMIDLVIHLEGWDENQYYDSIFGQNKMYNR